MDARVPRRALPGDDLRDLQAALLERQRQIAEETKRLEANAALAGALLSVVSGLRTGDAGPSGSQLGVGGGASARLGATRAPPHRESIRAARNRAVRGGRGGALPPTAMPSTEHVRSAVGGALLQQLLDAVLGPPASPGGDATSAVTRAPPTAGSPVAGEPPVALVPAPDGAGAGTAAVQAEGGSAGAPSVTSAQQPSSEDDDAAPHPPTVAADEPVAAAVSGGSSGAAATEAAAAPLPPAYVPTAAIEASYRALDAIARDLALQDTMLAVPPPAPPPAAYAPSHAAASGGGSAQEPPRTLPLHESDRFRWVPEEEEDESEDAGTARSGHHHRARRRQQAGEGDESVAALCRLLGVTPREAASGRFAHLLRGGAPTAGGSSTGIGGERSSADGVATPRGNNGPWGQVGGSPASSRGRGSPSSDVNTTATVAARPAVGGAGTPPPPHPPARWLERSALSSIALASYESRPADGYVWQRVNDGGGGASAPATATSPSAARRGATGAPEWLPLADAAVSARGGLGGSGGAATSGVGASWGPSGAPGRPLAPSTLKPGRPAPADASLVHAAATRYADALSGAASDSVSAYLSQPPPPAAAPALAAAAAVTSRRAGASEFPATLGRQGDPFGTSAVEALCTSRALYTSISSRGYGAADGGPRATTAPPPVARDAHGVFALPSATAATEAPAPLYVPRPLLSATGQPIPDLSAPDRHLPLRDEGGGYAGYGGSGVVGGAPGVAAGAPPRVPVRVLIRP